MKGSSQNTSQHRLNMYAGSNLLCSTELKEGQGAPKKKGMWD